MNTLISSLSVSASTIVDFNLRSVKGNLILVVEPSASLTLTLKNGVGNNDPAQTSTTPIPYVQSATGSSVPIFESTGTSYPISAGTKEAILLVRSEIGEWLRAELVTTGTVSIYGNPN
jgi:hypothetical protein